MVALVWLVAGLVFVVVGAWPVLPFLGLEALLLYGAFRLHQHAGNACEAINLTPRSLTVHRIDHWGKRSEFHFPPHWLQVNLDEPPGRRSPLELRSHGNSLTIGSFLLPEERLRLARSLRRELDRLSAVRHTA
jgi:uncharacterized membrane protein